MLLLGIDVGGTHTDAVALGPDRIEAQVKVATNHDDLLSSIRNALGEIVRQTDPARIKQLNLSTTLSTNAIVEGKLEDVGVIVSAGPGLDPHSFMTCKDFHVIPGSLDHRGSETKQLNNLALEEAISSCRKSGVKVYAAVTKFSPRNPSHEKAIELAVGDNADFITLGHQITGRLNFPRRIATAFYNCAVWRIFNNFADAISGTLEEMGLGHIKVNILKADGGTMPLPLSRKVPVQSIFSGPAASVMGIIALCKITHDSIIYDIGGTTTDIAIFVGGTPLIEQEGINIGSYPTLVRALKVHSIGVGGDSAISILEGIVRVGPTRLGPSIAFGGKTPTLTDALIWKGSCDCGDIGKSKAGFAVFASKMDIDPEDLADKAIENAINKIHDSTRELVEEINQQPVYTIHELLENRRIVPRKIYMMGGPAKAMKMDIFRKFRLSTEVPENYDVANAIGAALTRTTTEIELFADTERGVMFIPSLGYRENVPRNYKLENAEKDAMNHLLAHLGEMSVAADGANALITSSSSFNMMNGSTTVGRNIRVKCQIKPGVVRTYS
ncbi:hydantoinase/oxoprolinase family protein [Maridesulfovibrio ferrireducens]|uniref:hydantoinase/oxoprolinase family protein n=1 Tax=Maridesulfovibrio ferrireducens TaxID=246191 RepID=UPI001A356B0C|nr:hydantoinase/oxoprolinase family protein [Maridesulfovibrio ferrireducens]MBI9111771.1 hydantoinase/oxoprolinase family protein [Maridesulfovibrio ferrireducens]